MKLKFGKPPLLHPRSCTNAPCHEWHKCVQTLYTLVYRHWKRYTDIQYCSINNIHKVRWVHWDEHWTAAAQLLKFTRRWQYEHKHYNGRPWNTYSQCDVTNSRAGIDCHDVRTALTPQSGNNLGVMQSAAAASGTDTLLPVCTSLWYLYMCCIQFSLGCVQAPHRDGDIQYTYARDSNKCTCNNHVYVRIEYQHQRWTYIVCVSVGSRTLSILYSGFVRTISILKAERVCGARHNKSEDMHIQTESCLCCIVIIIISISHYVDYWKNTLLHSTVFC